MEGLGSSPARLQTIRISLQELHTNTHTHLSTEIVLEPSLGICGPLSELDYLSSDVTKLLHHSFFFPFFGRKTSCRSSVRSVFLLCTLKLRYTEDLSL